MFYIFPAFNVQDNTLYFRPYKKASGQNNKVFLEDVGKGYSTDLLKSKQWSRRY